MGMTLPWPVCAVATAGVTTCTRPLLAASDECAVWVFSKLELAQPAELWRRGRRIAALGKDGEAQRF